MDVDVDGVGGVGGVDDDDVLLFEEELFVLSEVLLVEELLELLEVLFEVVVLLEQFAVSFAEICELVITEFDIFKSFSQRVGHVLFIFDVDIYDCENLGSVNIHSGAQHFVVTFGNFCFNCITASGGSA